MALYLRVHLLIYKFLYWIELTPRNPEKSVPIQDNMAYWRCLLYLWLRSSCRAGTWMSNETYLNHPTFGLLYRVCLLEENQEIFTTLYAQRLFFLVATTASKTIFEPITRADAKLMVENRLRWLRRNGEIQAYQVLFTLHKNTF